MKTALIAAIVSAVVAAARGTAATIVVTSKNIENGTIQTVDISAKAKRALKGNRGPRGFLGLQGEEGPEGHQGPAYPIGTADGRGAWYVVDAQHRTPRGGVLGHRVLRHDVVAHPRTGRAVTRNEPRIRATRRMEARG
jgi:hypothetical protein